MSVEIVWLMKLEYKESVPGYKLRTNLLLRNREFDIEMSFCKHCVDAFERLEQRLSNMFEMI